MNFIMKNISMLSSMTMINHYLLIDSTDSYNICYFSWLASRLELAHYKTSWLVIKRAGSL
jgi:hypothetical protein